MSGGRNSLIEAARAQAPLAPAAAVSDDRRALRLDCLRIAVQAHKNTSRAEELVTFARRLETYLDEPEREETPGA